MDLDLAEDLFYFQNIDQKSLDIVLDSDTKEKFYLNLLTVSMLYL